MPVSSVSEAFSWGAYLVAGVGITAVFLPVVGGVYSQSLAFAGRSTVDSVAQLLNNLGPGESVTLRFQGVAGRAVTLSGHSVMLAIGGERFVGQCIWNLPNATLTDGASYTAALAGGDITVKQYVGH